jgi:hypothetical protein
LKLLQLQFSTVVAAADNNEFAFRLVEIELEKDFLKKPEVSFISLYEKTKMT